MEATIPGQQETEKVKGAEKEKGGGQVVHCRVDQECLVAESQRENSCLSRWSHLVSEWPLRAGRERDLCHGASLLLLFHWSTSALWRV